MSDLDNLARDMAWIEQRRIVTGKTATTKAGHWRAMTEEAREGWRNMARRFCYFLHRLTDDAINDAHILGDLGTGK